MSAFLLKVFIRRTKVHHYFKNLLFSVESCCILTGNELNLRNLEKGNGGYIIIRTGTADTPHAA